MTSMVFAFDYGSIRLLKCHRPGDRFIIYGPGDKHTFLTLSEDRRLFDKDGHEYACEDEALMVDTIDRPGIGPLSLPADHWSEAAAGPHDFQTSCKVYQMSNPRSRAEHEFAERLDAVSHSTGRKIVSKILATISKSLSWAFWDVKKTRWK